MSWLAINRRIFLWEFSEFERITFGEASEF